MQLKPAGADKSRSVERADGRIEKRDGFTIFPGERFDPSVTWHSESTRRSTLKKMVRSGKPGWLGLLLPTNSRMPRQGNDRCPVSFDRLASAEASRFLHDSALASTNRDPRWFKSGSIPNRSLPALAGRSIQWLVFTKGQADFRRLPQAAMAANTAMSPTPIDLTAPEFNAFTAQIPPSILCFGFVSNQLLAWR